MNGVGTTSMILCIAFILCWAALRTGCMGNNRRIRNDISPFPFLSGSA